MIFRKKEWLYKSTAKNLSLQVSGTNYSDEGDPICISSMTSSPIDYISFINYFTSASEQSKSALMGCRLRLGSWALSFAKTKLIPSLTHVFYWVGLVHLQSGHQLLQSSDLIINGTRVSNRRVFTRSDPLSMKPTEYIVQKRNVALKVDLQRLHLLLIASRSLTESFYFDCLLWKE